MTFLSPIFLYLGVAAAAGAVALHFIVTRQPSSTPLPTARFVPVSSERGVRPAGTDAHATAHGPRRAGRRVARRA